MYEFLIMAVIWWSVGLILIVAHSHQYYRERGLTFFQVVSNQCKIMNPEMFIFILCMGLLGPINIILFFDIKDKKDL